MWVHAVSNYYMTYINLVIIMCIIVLLDTNECEANPCDQICKNTEGSFDCSCFMGYRLQEDGRSCLGEV